MATSRPPDPPKDHKGRVIDFGRTAEDYDRHRPGFPDSVFDSLEERRWVSSGKRALDLGTGTGSFALGLAERGLQIVGLDRSPQLLEVARRRAGERGLDARFTQGVAEATGEAAASYDLVVAGQCWWWFDAARVLQETERLLVDDGRIIVASFCYLPLPGTIAARTEEIILRHNPGWGAAWSSGVFPEQLQDFCRAGFRQAESYSYDVDVAFTQESWRGRIRACNGVAASLDEGEVEAVDRELADLLRADFPEPLSILHRVFVASAIRPRSSRVGMGPT